MKNNANSKFTIEKMVKTKRWKILYGWQKFVWICAHVKNINSSFLEYAICKRAHANEQTLTWFPSRWKKNKNYISANDDSLYINLYSEWTKFVCLCVYILCAIEFICLNAQRI